MGACDQGADDQIQKIDSLQGALCCSVVKMIEHFGVELDDELTEMVKLHHEMTVVTLQKIRLKKISVDYWVSQAEEEGVFTADENVNGEDGARMSAVAIGEEMVVIPFIPQVDKGEPLSRFEKMLIRKMDTLTVK